MNAAAVQQGCVAIDYLNQVGFDFIQEQNWLLTQRAMEGLGKDAACTCDGLRRSANHTGMALYNRGCSSASMSVRSLFQTALMFVPSPLCSAASDLSWCSFFDKSKFYVLQYIDEVDAL